MFGILKGKQVWSHLFTSCALGVVVLGAAAPAQGAVDMKINFQPATAAVPSGYQADGGLPFSATRGYGWVREDSLGGTPVGLDLTSRSRDRGKVSDQRLDTLIHLNLAGAPSGAWQAAVPNDRYVVTVAAGDPAAFDSTHRVNVEGTTVLGFAASTSDRMRTATQTVTVSDGMLTLDGIGGTNTKFQYVDISTAPEPPVAGERRFNFQPDTAPAAPGYAKDTGAAFTDARGYGWVRADSLSGAHVGLDLTRNTRDRGRLADQRLDTFIHVQYPGGSTGVATPGAWELAVPDGVYDVTVAVGDASAYDSSHSITVEDQRAIDNFVPTASSRFRAASRTVNVTDGRLTVNAVDGLNTKLDFVEVQPATTGPRPAVGDVQPADGATLVARGRAITAEVLLPNLGAGVDTSTLTDASVRLEKISDGTSVPAVRNTSGGGDVIVLQPHDLLEPATEYRFIVNNRLKDTSGATFQPSTTTFTTGSSTPGQSTLAKFTKVPQPTSAGEMSASVAMGPDGRLYSTTLDGKILRFPVAADGSLGVPTTIQTVATNEGEPRHILGLAFDPAATASNPILWVSHGDGAFADAPDWSGKISRLSGANLGTIRNVVVGLPRSVRDHETNSVAFGPDGALYVTQGSNSATGETDQQWGRRSEHALTASVLRIDTAAIPGTLNVKTAEGGTYDPFASGAPVTIYASGVRNAYDLVWDSNGELYVPVNGSAAGGNTPATPSPLPASCDRRLDFGANGPFTGPSVTGLTYLPAQPDLLLRIKKGGFYGHPNPSRCEFTFFGGNPTSGADPLEATRYPVGTQPDRNFRRPSWNFGLHFSPNGAVEYRSDKFGGALQGKLLVARYSAGDDLVAMTINPSTREIVDQEDGIPGLGGFVDPLDVTEDTRNGNLYVTELGAARITLLRPDES